MKKIFSSLFGKYLGLFIAVLFATNLISGFIMVLLTNLTNLPQPSIMIGEESIYKFEFLFRMGLITLIIGTVFSFIATRIVIKPISRISEVTKKVANGDFTARVTNKSKGYDEITELSDNINRMVIELSRNEYLHKDFVSNVSHEFKTPITAIQGYAELLESPGLSEEKRLAYAKIIIGQSNRLAKLSSNLLRLSELERDSFIIKKEYFSLDEQIREAILLLQNEWEQKNLEVDIELDAVQYLGDKTLIYQVWINLMTNAIRYSTEGGKITVIMKEDDHIKVTIKDTGIGMSSEQVERVFERFYKADKSRESIGTGLGLSIVKRIVEMHGGNIVVESEYGEGSSFIVEF